MDQEESIQSVGEEQTKARWQPLSSTERRIVGVLVEKAKTTPDQYPLSLNSLVSGCNQKSNRDPMMHVEPHQVETAMDRLRELGAIAEVQGGGRVPRYRHYMKDWLGVDGAGLAVMAELLLRGAQTIGDLRGRAARMAPIASVAELRPVLAELQEKGLLIALTPSGRGQIVTHALYKPEEMEKVRRKAGLDSSSQQTYGVTGAGGQDDDDDGPPARSPSSPALAAPATTAPAASWSVQDARSGGSTGSQAGSDEVDSLRREVKELREEVSRLKQEVEDIWANLR